MCANHRPIAAEKSDPSQTRYEVYGRRICEHELYSSGLRGEQSSRRVHNHHGRVFVQNRYKQPLATVDLYHGTPARRYDCCEQLGRTCTAHMFTGGTRPPGIPPGNIVHPSSLRTIPPLESPAGLLQCTYNIVPGMTNDT